MGIAESSHFLSEYPGFADCYSQMSQIFSMTLKESISICKCFWKSHHLKMPLGNKSMDLINLEIQLNFRYILFNCLDPSKLLLYSYFKIRKSPEMWRNLGQNGCSIWMDTCVDHHGAHQRQYQQYEVVAAIEYGWERFFY